MRSNQQKTTGISKSGLHFDMFLKRKLQLAEKLRRGREYDAARKACGDVLALDPRNDQALFTLGHVLTDMERFREAEDCLAKGASFYPDNWRILTLLSTVKARMRHYDEAFALVERARKLSPHNNRVKVALAELLFEWKDYAEAAKMLRIVLRKEPTFNNARMLLSDCYFELGDAGAAAELLRRLFDGGFRTIAMMERLTRLPTSLFSIDVLPFLQQFDGAPGIDPGRYRFIRAQAHHRAGRHEDAWAEAVAANAIRKQKHAKEWRDSHPEREKALQYARQSTNDAPPMEAPGKLPISLFMLGMSRSGKTTLERLVAALPGVVRGYESPLFGDAALKATERSGRAFFQPGDEFQHYLPPNRTKKFVELYVAALRKKAGDARVFTTTSPGLISKSTYLSYVIPRSRFVFIRRDEQDLIFRIYMTSYRRGNSYAYDVGWIKQYIDWYYEIIDVFTSRFPEISTVVEYEHMVEDPAATIDAVARLCGIDGRADPPRTGDDRGVSQPYAEHIRAALLA